MRRGWCTMLQKFILSFFLLLQASTLPAIVNQVRLTLTGICCEFCSSEIEENFRAMHGLNDLQIFPHAGIVEIDWNPELPLHAALLLQPVSNTRFAITDIFVDFEGTFHNYHTAPHIRSDYDGAMFFIDNMNATQLKDIKEGDIVRVKADLTNKQGFNFIVVREVVSIREPESVEGENAEAFSR